LLTAALFPRKFNLPSASTDASTADPDIPGPPDSQKGKNPVERMAISCIMSIAIVSLLGLGLDNMPWGITLRSSLITISAFIAAMSIIAIIVQSRFPVDKSDTSLFRFRLPGRAGNLFNRRLSAFLFVGILAAVGILIFCIVSPRVIEKTTEYYILGINSKADEYPSVFLMKNNQIVSVRYGKLINRTSSEPARVTLGITNHEHHDTVYSVAITIDGQPVGVFNGGQFLNRIEQIALPQNGRWEQEIGFTPVHAGDHQKVEFLFYKNGSPLPDKALN
jgi:uncharacterized membrane protein